MTRKTYDVLDRPEVQGVLFYPRRDIGIPRLNTDAITVRIPVSQDIAIGGKLYVAAPRSPTILYFHGNGEIASDYDTIAPFYTRLGINLLVMDYRGYGASDGAPSATALIDDAWLCYEKSLSVMAEHGVESGPLFVMGRSLGSAAALEISHRAQDDLGGLIIESGFAYTFALIERIGFMQLPDAFEQQDGFGNLEKISRSKLRTLIIHGEWDLIIPISDADALFDASPAAEKSLVRIPEAGHNDLMMVGRKSYFDAIAAFCGLPPLTE